MNRIIRGGLRQGRYQVRLRTKAALLLFGILFLLSGVNYSLAKKITRSAFQEIEQVRNQEDIERVKNIFLRSIIDIERSTKDWAFWNDTYNYLIDKNKAYTESNLTGNGVESLNLSDIILLTNDGKIFDGDQSVSEEQKSIREQYITALSHYPQFLKLVNPDQEAKGFLSLPNKVYIYSAKPILTSQKEGPSRGTLIFVKEVTKEYIDEMLSQARQSLVKFTLFPQNSSFNSFPYSDIIEEKSPDTLLASIGFRDITGKPAFSLQLSFNRPELSKSTELQSLLFWFFFASGALCLLAGILLLERSIVRRLSYLSAQVSSIGESGNVTQRITIDGSDELAEFCIRMNMMLHNLELEREAHNAKKQFIVNMNHELRTPTHAILGFAERLNGFNLEKDASDILSELKKACSSLRRLMESIFDLSKIDEGLMIISEEEFTLSELVVEVKNLLQFHVDKRAQFLVIEVDQKIPQYLIGDRQKLTQVIYNLCENGLKFSEGESEVQLTMREVSRLEAQHSLQLLVEVTDTGIGIPEQFQDKVFDRFFQRDESMTRAYGGAGIGLSVCKEITEKMNGTLSVESTPGKGSIFRLELSLKYLDNKPTRISSEQTLPFSRVLLVEDNKVNQRIAKMMLEKDGLQVSIANNGKEALESIAKEEYDIILMDCQMPEMDGYEATQKIRALGGRYLHLPIVAVTANTSPGDRERCIEVGMTDYLSKPFSRDELISKMKEAKRAAG